ncbi:MAG: hypothetical protein PHW50_03130 [Patescibacteria group bacterium]|nr:hypothetical protein [Patescibacteria group bacterium]
MRKIIVFNLILIGLWVISFLLTRINFSYLIYVLGLLVFFLPGLNLTLAIEQFTGRIQGMTKIIFWSFLASFTITLGVIFKVFAYWRVLNAENTILIAFFSLWLLTLVLLSVSYRFKQVVPTDFSWDKIKKHRIFWLAVFIWLLILLIHMLLYRFIPGADPYKYLMRVTEAMQTNFISDGSRALFYIFSWALSFLTRIPLYFIYKIILPSFSIILILLFYQLSRQISKNSFIILIGSLSIATVPVLVMEILISRPQSFFMLLLPLFLFLATELIKTKKINNLPWFLYLLVVASFSLRIHQFFLITFILCLISFIIFYWSVIKKYPWASTSIIFLLVLNFYSWIEKFGLMRFINTFYGSLTNVQFRLWFLNNFTNIDGVKVSWSGIGILYYYGYFLGLILPSVIILILIIKNKFKFNWQNNWLYFLSFILFFAIAEIFPRLGLFYLPDRAWVFASISLLFFLPPLLGIFVRNFKPKIGKIILSILLIITIGLAWYLSYSKQGEISLNEYEASQFIKNNLNKEAVIISQPNNGVVVRYFADRILIVPQASSFFNDDWGENDQKFINNLPNIISQKSLYLRKEKTSEQKIKQIESEISKIKNIKEAEKLAQQLITEIQKLQRIKRALSDIAKNNLDKQRPIFILYSNDKFDNLAGARDSRRDKNFYNANLDKFDKHPELFQKIYNQNNIYIWEVKQ